MGSIVEDSIVDEHANKDWRVVETPSQARVMTSKSRLLALRIILARLDLYSDKEDGRGSEWTPGAGNGRTLLGAAAHAIAGLRVFYTLGNGSKVISDVILSK